MPSGVYKRTNEHRKKISLSNIGRISAMKGRYHSQITRDKIRQSESGNKHYNWRGGRQIHNGYIISYKPDHPFADHHGYVREHRLIYEESRNCCLLSWIHIHHLDENRLNNTWYNLKPLTRSEHGRLSAKASWGQTWGCSFMLILFNLSLFT